MTPSPRKDASEPPVAGCAVPKTGQKNSLPRDDATEVPMGKVAVPKGADSTVHRPVRDRSEDRLAALEWF